MKKIVISLGGSLIVPKVGFLDLNFIKKFKNLILKFARKYRIFIVVGGGKLARFYQQEARHLKIKRTDLDWLGIFASRLNTQFVKSFFDQQSFSEIITSPLKKIRTKKIVFLSGWKPGWTTDFVATKICQVYKVKEILNLTNVDYIYDRDPRKNKKAKPLKKISWSDYLKIIGRRFKPGGNYPFDPVASLLAKKLKIKLISLNGKNLKAVDNYLTGKKFIGSIIK